LRGYIKNIITILLVAILVLLLNYNAFAQEIGIEGTSLKVIKKSAVTNPTGIQFGFWANYSKQDGVLKDFGKIDILVNNAGITRDAFFHKMTDEQWYQVMNVNLFGTYNCTKYVVPLMREQEYGKIVSITSSSAYGNMGQANYSASKAALIGFTKTLAKELSGKNVTVNAIAPSMIATDILKTMPESLKEQALKHAPAHRYGTPEELANAVLFLSCDDSSYVNGVNLDVNGGLFT
jgi:NAD(P)-dependent dehydrogenase (short-subunit alcohol dehydrogenase family)